MKKMKMHSPKTTQANIAHIRELFPSCVTEVKREHGELELAIDFDLLRQELSESIVEGPQERYHLNWPGKRESLLTANTPIAKTLRPCREESVNFDTTKNLFIEGDNLEALKLLQETYLGKVKMIYIDPPYNTGNNFLYKDDFAESDWLSMMYPRLKLARNLLRDDGVIFISIDDNEVSNLRKLCDEVFGEDNFVAKLIWKRRVSSSMADNNVSLDHEYVICYKKKSIDFLGLEKDFKNYSNPDNDVRGDWISDNLTVGMSASMRPNQAYDLIDPKSGVKYPFNPNRVWAYIPESMNKLIAEGRIIFPSDPNKRPMFKRFRNELKSNFNPFSSIMLDCVGLNTEAARLMQGLMGGAVFEYSKPLSLSKTLLGQVTNSDDIVLDFFAGSSTTAHAVMQLNAEDGGNRKFIMVQLPEPCDKKSEAFKAGFKTIAEISKERIRRAGKKILEGDCHESWNKDVGFRVFKIDSSNMAEVYYTPDSISQKQLDLFTDNIKPDRTPEDLLFQVLLDWGVDLSLPVHKKTVQGKSIFFVDGNALIACFDKDVSEKLVKELATFNPVRVVFRNDGFKSDAVKINVEQIFKEMSPGTEVRSI